MGKGEKKKMSDIVFCTDCKWFIQNKKAHKPLNDNERHLIISIIHKIDEATGTKFPNESYWECSHQFNIGKKVEWWGLLRYYKRKPSQINAKNDCVRFEKSR